MLRVSELRGIAGEICAKYGTMCYGDRDPDELVLFGFTWVENFYYVDPVECSRDLECIETVFKMHSTVLKLALEGRYIVNINRELLKEAVKRLLALSNR
jgi:hypothetical protein